jgi:2'-5' RNA ligase superfamily
VNLKQTRQQLTLFISKEDSGAIESIRKKYNPEQYQLIGSHVTLCREEELADAAIVLGNLQYAQLSAITIQFGAVTRFDNGKGVLIPASGNNEAFHQLRQKLLAKTAEPLRRPEPHITLMHPRNSTCTDGIFAAIQSAKLPACLTFNKISLIQQIDGGKWEIQKAFSLTSTGL